MIDVLQQPGTMLTVWKASDGFVFEDGLNVRVFDVIPCIVLECIKLDVPTGTYAEQTYTSNSIEWEEVPQDV